MALVLITVLTSCSAASKSVTPDHSLSDAIVQCVGKENVADRERRFDGMSEQEARHAAQAAGWSIRILGENGECGGGLVTADLRRDRLNLFFDRQGRVAWAGRF